MRKTTALPVLVLIAIALLCPVPVAAVSRGIHVVEKGGKSLYLYKDYHALVVGVGDYTRGWPDLPNAVKDAKEVSGALKRLGVKVKLVTDPTSQELEKALNDLTYKQGREGNRALIFYYAGHGETESLADGTKLGYIIPRDCPLLRDDPHGFVTKAVSMKDMEAYSLRMRSKHVLMLFDSCFSGSLFSLVRAVPEDICEKSALPVRQYITAGKEDEPVPDRSMFKRCLLLGLQGDADLTRDGYITGTELGMYLSDKVVLYTKRRQHPQYGKINNPDLDRGDFIFQLASSAAVVEKPSRKESGATLSVKCNVSGAKVLLDNRNLGSTQLSDVSVSPGEYRIRVEKDGYEPYRKRIRLEEGRSITLQVNLSEERPANGRLFVETEPGDARVRILNITPKFYQGIELEPGRYNVEISASGHETQKQWVELGAGEDKYIDIRLKKIRVAEAAGPSGKSFTNSISMKFVLIPAGSFMMGSPSDEPGRYNDEMQHRVTISKPFYIQTTEVTQGQWQEVMGNNPSKFKGDDRPVENVSWNDVQAFIGKLNNKEGTDKHRVPTEAEWEYACRAGSTTRFCFGNNDGQLGEYAWYGGNSSSKTHSVGQKKPNAWGLYDMHGNVWEWCQDRCEWENEVVTDTYRNGIVDPLCNTGSRRVNRGGSWLFSARGCGSASRGRDDPGRWYVNLGFRLARTP